jgi:hypothetical protein
MARRGLAGLAALAACFGLLAASGAGTSAAPAVCQLAGSWSQTTTDVGSTTWAITADGKAQEHGIGNASGTASLSGNVLTITWTTSDGYAGVYRWTLDEQCGGSGTLTFTKVAPGDPRQGQSFASTVDGPPPVKAPGGCGSAASVRSAGAAPGCTETKRKEPGPGGSVATSSPKLGSGATTETVSVSSYSGDLNDSTIVAEGERKRAKRKKFVEDVTACILIGPDAIELNPDALEPWLANGEIQQAFQKASLEDTLALCMFVVKRYGKTATEPPSASSARVGCRSRRIVFDVRRNPKGRITSVKVGRSRAKVRYGCTSAGGAAKITAKARGGLRRAVGSRLDIGLVRHPNAPRRSAQVTFRFVAR